MAKSKNVFLKESKASWWVGAFVLFTYMLALKTSHSKEEQIARLTEQLSSLTQEKSFALQSQYSLLTQIESQKDPLWIEMVLMKKLGVVPEGQIKVLFKKEDEGTLSYIDGS